jgi:hypothetical protein
LGKALGNMLGYDSASDSGKALGNTLRFDSGKVLGSNLGKESASWVRIRVSIWVRNRVRSYPTG